MIEAGGNIFEFLDHAQRDMLVRLPYRIGLWVSQSDSEGGSEAEARELRALSSTLHGFAQEVFSSETAQRIITETIQARTQWPGWTERLQNVPEECRRAIDILKSHCSAKDVAAFSNLMMEIGEAVAASFREREAGVIERFQAYMVFAGPTAAGIRRRKSFEEYMNISPNERKALKILSDAFGLGYW